MANKCCICSSNQVQQDEDIILFNFPISSCLRKKWKAAIQLSERITYDMMVCSKHFQDSEYKTVRGKPRLCGKAVPSLYLKNKPDTEKDRKTDENSIDNDIKNKQPSESTDRRLSAEKTLTNQLLTEVKLTEKLLTDEKLTETHSTDEKLTEKLLTDENLIEKLSPENRLPESDISKEDTPKLDTETKRDKIDKIVENSDTDSAVSEKQETSVVTSSEVSKENSVKKIVLSDCEVNNDSRVSENAKSKSKKSDRRTRTVNFGNRSRFNNESIMSTFPGPGPKEDIEELLTNYHIQNNGQLVMESSVQKDVQQAQKEPVFIEISVGRDPHSSAPAETPGSQDCLMVLESVQCDVDPSNFLLPEQEYDVPDDDDDVQCTENKKPDPISLLTSSDESDVILEEPKIDTVEVSDETDEDDVPLVKLVPKDNKEKTEIAKIMWGLYEYYCIKCKFYSTNKNEYTRHVKEHEKVLQMCQICGFTTASKYQFDRHRRKHREDRRFKCHLCDYKARHNMSLIYHLKTHEKTGFKSGYSCRCGFYTNSKTEMLKHVKACNGTDGVEPDCDGKGSKRLSSKGKRVAVDKKHSCKFCSYKTNRRTDLKRHVASKHSDLEDDEDYVP